MENTGIFYEHLAYFTAIGNILWSFGIFCGHLIYFSPFWYLVPRKFWQPCFAFGPTHINFLRTFCAFEEPARKRKTSSFFLSENCFALLCKFNDADKDVSTSSEIGEREKSDSLGPAAADASREKMDSLNSDIDG
jgi:hypothetical protein